MRDPLLLISIGSAAFCVLALAIYSNSVSGFRRASTPGAQNAAEGPDGAWSVARIFWVALLVRLGVSMLIVIGGYTDFFAPDRWGYERAGAAIAEAWRGFGTVSVAGMTAANGKLAAYHYFNGVFFYVFGEVAPTLIKAVNCLAGAVAIPLVYRIGVLIFGRDGGVRAAWLVALMPSMVLWSALNIRDAWAMLAILWTVLAALKLREGITAQAGISLLMGLTLLGAVRGYMFLIIAVGVLLSYVAGWGGSVFRNYAAGAVVAGVFLYLYGSLGFGRDMAETASFEMLNQQRESLASGGSAYYEDIDISSPGKAMLFLPVGVTYFLFAPFPWMLRNVRQLLTFPEMLVWWWLAFRHLVPGIRLGLRLKSGQMQTILCVAGLSIAAYGLVEGNVGTAYRHRAQVLPLLLIVAAGGWAYSKAKSGALKERPPVGRSESSATGRVAEAPIR